jgi:hypothetical protein
MQRLLPARNVQGYGPGVVSLPHGWGHDVEASRLTVAKAHAGVNTNVLTDNQAYDEASGGHAPQFLAYVVGKA